MPMTPFVERFPEVGASETRSAMVMPGQDLPAGNYGFLELYCNEPGCDCRRVIIQVLRPETGWSEVWATISYGWESQEFYRSKVGDDSDERGPYLDPLNSQSKYSPVLLDLFRTFVRLPDYVERLKRHYRMFKDSVAKEHGRLPGLETKHIENRRKRLRDPRRRRGHPR